MFKSRILLTTIYLIFEISVQSSHAMDAKEESYPNSEACKRTHSENLMNIEINKGVNNNSAKKVRLETCQSMLEQLPPEVTIHIANYLCGNNFLNITLASKFINNVLKKELFAKLGSSIDSSIDRTIEHVKKLMDYQLTYMELVNLLYDMERFYEGKEEEATYKVWRDDAIGHANKTYDGGSVR